MQPSLSAYQLSAKLACTKLYIFSDIFQENPIFHENFFEKYVIAFWMIYF